MPIIEARVMPTRSERQLQRDLDAARAELLEARRELREARRAYWDAHATAHNWAALCAGLLVMSALLCVALAVAGG